MSEQYPVSNQDGGLVGPILSQLRTRVVWLSIRPLLLCSIATLLIVLLWQYRSALSAMAGNFALGIFLISGLFLVIALVRGVTLARKRHRDRSRVAALIDSTLGLKERVVTLEQASLSEEQRWMLEEQLGGEFTSIKPHFVLPGIFDWSEWISVALIASAILGFTLASQVTHRDGGLVERLSQISASPEISPQAKEALAAVIEAARSESEDLGDKIEVAQAALSAKQSSSDSKSSSLSRSSSSSSISQASSSSALSTSSSSSASIESSKSSSALQQSSSQSSSGSKQQTSGSNSSGSSKSGDGNAQTDNQSSKDDSSASKGSDQSGSGEQSSASASEQGKQGGQSSIGQGSSAGDSQQSAGSSGSGQNSSINSSGGSHSGKQSSNSAGSQGSASDQSSSGQPQSAKDEALQILSQMKEGKADSSSSQAGSQQSSGGSQSSLNNSSKGQSSSNSGGKSSSAGGKKPGEASSQSSSASDDASSTGSGAGTKGGVSSSASAKRFEDGPDGDKGDRGEKFEEHSIAPKDERLDERFTTGGGELSKDDQAKPGKQLTIGDLQRAKPSAVQVPSKQRIPREYEGVLSGR